MSEAQKVMKERGLQYMDTFRVKRTYTPANARETVDVLLENLEKEIIDNAFVYKMSDRLMAVLGPEDIIFTSPQQETILYGFLLYGNYKIEEVAEFDRDLGALSSPFLRKGCPFSLKDWVEVETSGS